MSSCFKRKIKEMREAYFTDRQHDKWIGLIGRYYRDVQQDPGNTEIYLHKLLNGGVLDKEAFKTVSEEKSSDSFFDYKYLYEEKKVPVNRTITGKMIYIIKGIILELEKYGRILSHRKS